MRFETERLIIRPWREEDAQSLFEYAKDERVGPNAGWPVHTSVENSLEIIQNVLMEPLTYAICLKEDNVAIGSVGLKTSSVTYLDILDTELEVGYWIGVPFWGKGYVPEAVRCIQKYAFETLECTGLWCGYYDGNEKSKRVMEKCGFVYHHMEPNKQCVLMGDERTEHYTFLSMEDWKEKA